MKEKSITVVKQLSDVNMESESRNKIWAETEVENKDVMNGGEKLKVFRIYMKPWFTPPPPNYNRLC